ncbi:MAG TPA: AI-2E family transporter [Pyrinomonadaceae bacterium]|nr:AI-2E family transporter [Pyrinomonadaceae bacterium]
MSHTNRNESQTPTGGGWPSPEKAHGLVLIAATALALYVCYRLVQPFIPALTWAVVLAIVAQPLHGWLAAHVARPNLASGLAVAVVAVVIVAPGVLMGQQLLSQARKGLESVQANAAPERWQAAVESNPRMARVLGWVEPHLDVRAAAEQATGAITSRLPSFAIGSAWALVQLLITFFTLFYLFRDRRTILRMLRTLVPLSQSDTDKLFARVADTIYATVYGTFVVSGVQGLLGGLMFWWLGLPVPLLWGTVMFLTSLVPILGAPVVWIPASLFLIVTGSWIKALVLVGWGLIVIGSIDNLLYPVLVGDRVRLHTLLVFFSVVGGLLLFGAAGLVLGPVAVVVTMLLIDVWRQRSTRVEAH